MIGWIVEYKINKVDFKYFIIAYFMTLDHDQLDSRIYVLIMVTDMF